MDFSTIQALSNDNPEQLNNNSFDLLPNNQQLDAILQYADINFCNYFIDNCTDNSFIIDGEFLIPTSKLIEFRRFDLFYKLEHEELLFDDIEEDEAPLYLCITHTSCDFFSYYLNKCSSVEQILGWDLTTKIDPLKILKSPVVAASVSNNDFYIKQLETKITKMMTSSQLLKSFNTFESLVSKFKSITSKKLTTA